MQGADPHAPPKPRNIQESVESGSELMVSEESLEVIPPVWSQAGPPTPFECTVVLRMVLAYLAIYLAVVGLFLVGALLDQVCFELSTHV